MSQGANLTLDNVFRRRQRQNTMHSDCGMLYYGKCALYV
jgi:hypothetical protein